jgi:hypothetical protein
MGMERCWKDGDKEKQKFWKKSQVVHCKSQRTDKESKPILRGKTQASFERKKLDLFFLIV